VADPVAIGPLAQSGGGIKVFGFFQGRTHLLFLKKKKQKDFLSGASVFFGSSDLRHARSVTAVAIGNALDFYDFLTYAFFAVQIGHAFFPSSGAARGLMLSLATFGAGFLMRPLGGILIGLYADRKGRRPAMVLSFSLMGLGLAGVTLTPSYANIGPAAPVCLLFWRLVQGFALGGEVGPSTSLLMELAPPSRRGLYVSMQYAAQDFAVLAAGSVGFALANLLSPAALDSFGWRAAFGIGIVIVPFGLWLRHNLPETLLETAPGGQTPARPPWRLAGLGLMLIGCGTIVGYGFDYMTTFAQDALHLPANAAFGATVVLGIVLVATDIVAGMLCDRLGRKPLLLASVSLLLLGVIPLYALMIAHSQAGVVYGVTAVLGVLEAFITVPALLTLAELLPAYVRSATLGTIYAVSVSIFGGTTQFMMKWLSAVTGSTLAPSWYVTASLVMGAAAILRLKESRPRCSSSKTPKHRPPSSQQVADRTS
jgi:MHS family citrate/tricarballylate:H+ symporter-like MFS transporter